ncbi:peptidoglycan recognition protein family protein [Kitasatospora mediocidica]|uniref:peptidoglycan recognition protein family protein n=1 Tax=Kitasatospora mediocidica TaxID=58352 RepID=UPI00055EB326|nr:N-acetylmuramoyl-L-alanine amidase [Kitasatospora mediocidica]
MRISPISLIGTGCAAALLLQATGSGPTATAADAAGAVRRTDPGIAASSAPRTTSLALEALAPIPRTDRSAGPLTATRGLAARATAGYSLLGVSWDDPAATLDGSVQVRTRAADRSGHGAWSDWRALAADDEDRPDAGSAEQAGPRARGATAPLWVGPSDGVEVRAGAAGALPAGLRVELVDPGTDGPAVAVPQAPQARALPSADYGAPRPGIVTRAGWGADESIREPDFVYTGTVKEVFVHHTDTGNDYTCADSPKLIRAIYQYHVQSNGWRDIGYNFLVDKCGTIYEGRAGGVDRPVLGAHTLGFNTDSSGVAALGTFDSDQPVKAQLDGIAEIAAWKLGLTGQDAGSTVTLVSASDGSRYPKGTAHTFNTISGHRDAFATDCPGDDLYGHLADLRAEASHLQGRQ